MKRSPDTARVPGSRRCPAGADRGGHGCREEHLLSPPIPFKIPISLGLKISKTSFHSISTFCIFFLSITATNFIRFSVPQSAGGRVLWSWLRPSKRACAAQLPLPTASSPSATLRKPYPELYVWQVRQGPGLGSLQPKVGDTRRTVRLTWPERDPIPQ